MGTKDGGGMDTPALGLLELGSDAPSSRARDSLSVRVAAFIGRLRAPYSLTEDARLSGRGKGSPFPSRMTYNESSSPCWAS